MTAQVELTTYRASDRRIYNGAYCSDMSKEHNHTVSLIRRMKLADSTARCVYFPMEDKFLVFTNSNCLTHPDLVGPPEILTNNFHSNNQEAIIEAITVL